MPPKLKTKRKKTTKKPTPGCRYTGPYRKCVKFSENGVKRCTKYKPLKKNPCLKKAAKRNPWLQFLAIKREENPHMNQAQLAKMFRGEYYQVKNENFAMVPTYSGPIVEVLPDEEESFEMEQPRRLPGSQQLLLPGSQQLLLPGRSRPLLPPAERKRRIPKAKPRQILLLPPAEKPRRRIPKPRPRIEEPSTEIVPYYWTDKFST